MKNFCFLLLLMMISTVQAQETIEWNDQYQLQITDFQSPSSQIGNTTIYSLHTGIGPALFFQMSAAEFMFTRNFNSKIDNIFDRKSASLIAADDHTAKQLVAFAQYQFDLSELYARKIRKKLHEDKGMLSDVKDLKTVFGEINQEYIEKSATSGKTTDLGRNTSELKKLHTEIKEEIALLSDYCKSCKPKKKKK